MANKETRIFTTDTLETLRQKTNDVSLYLGDNEQFNASLSDKTFNYNNVSAGVTLITGLDVLNKTQHFNIKTEQTLDNTGGYIILTGSPTLTGFVAGATLTQTGGYSATIVSASTDKILVKNSSGTFSSSTNLVVGGNSIAASAVVRIIAEAFNIGVVRVYVNTTEISQNLLSGGFHVANYSAEIPLLNAPTVTAFTEGSTVYQGSSLASSSFSGTVLSASATSLKLKNHTGSFSASAVIKIDGSGSTITGANHSAITSIDTTIGNAIVLNTPAAANDDIKVFSPSLVDSINELQDDVGITENLTTVSGNLVGAVNEIEAVFDASTHEISAGSNAFNVTSGHFTIDANGVIYSDSHIGTTAFMKAGTIYGALIENSGELKLTTGSGNTTFLTADGQNATFSGTLDVDGNFEVGASKFNVTAATGNTQIDGILGVDGNFRVGASGASKLTVAAGTGNTQVYGTLEVNGTAGIDGDFNVGANKFNVAASSGNTQIDGTLEVDGTAGVDGNFRVGSSGGDKFNVTAASGNTQIDGTLNVDSTTTLNGTTIDGNLDLNGSVDVSTNATIHGVLDVDGVSNLDVVDIDGAVDMASTLQVDGNTTIDGYLNVGQLNAKFSAANRNNVKNALNELHDEIGLAVITGTGTAAAGLTNLTAAINSIDAEIGTVASYEGGTYGSTTISGVLTSLQTGVINNDTDITNLFADVGSLSLTDNLPSDYTYTVTDLTTATNTMSGFIGSTSIANIGSTDTVTGALQKLHGEIGDSNLSVFAASDISAALRELETEKVYLTSGTQQEIVSKLGLTGDVTFKNGGSNADTFTFLTGTTLDLSSSTLLLPGSASNINRFGTSFLEVDGNVETAMGFRVNRDHVTQANKSTVNIQWDENHTDGTSATKLARGWQLKGLNDAGGSHTTDIVTFYNAKELITSNTESGINVTWDASNENFDFNVNDPTLTFTGDVTGSGTITNLGNLSVALTVAANSVALGTDTTGNYIRTATGTNNQITVSPASHTENKDATFSIPNDFRMPGTAKVLSTTGSSSPTTGALTVAGGVGIGEDLYIAGNLVVQGDTVTLNTSTLTVEDTLVLAGNALGSEPSSGGFGLEVGPITSPSGVASNVTGAHSIVYNYGTDRWEADGSLILSSATLGAPKIEGSAFEANDNLQFSAGTGLSEGVSVSGVNTTVTYTNTDRGSSQAIFKNFTAGSGGTATANINNDTINFPNGSQIETVRSGDTITINHANTSSLNGTYGQSGAEDGTYIKSVTVDSNGHLTGVTSDDFDNRYDNYNHWKLYVDNSHVDSITTGERLGFDQGSGIDISFDGNDIAISHQDTSSAGSINNAGNNFIQDLSIDTFGHVTGHTSATVVIGDGTTTVTSGSGISLGGDTNWSANQSGASTFSVSHADTSTVGNLSSDNSNNTVIQDIYFTYDTFGHVLTSSVVTKDITTVTNANKLYTTATNLTGPYYPSMAGAYGNAYQDHYTDNSFSYNASTNTLTAGTFSGAVAYSNVTGKPTLDNYSYWRLYVNGGHVDDITSGEILDFNTGNAGISLSYTSGENVVITNNMHTNNTGIKDDSRNTNGVTRLFRRDDNSNYSVQTHWTGTFWQLEGYNGDTYHAPVRVERAEVAESVAYGNVSGTPTIGNGQIDGRTSGLGLSGSMDATADQTGNTTFTVNSNATVAANDNTLVYRDGSGHIFADHINTTSSVATTIQYISGMQSNNYQYKYTAPSIRTFLNVENGATLGYKVYRGYNDGTSGYVMQDGTSDGNTNQYFVGGSGITLSQATSFDGVGNDGLRFTNSAPNVTTNLSHSRSTTSITINSSDGTNTQIGSATSSQCGPMSVSDKNKLDGIAIGANNYSITGAFGAINIQTTGNVNASTVSGNLGSFNTVRSTGDIVAYYSDDRLKNRIGNIESALDKVNQLNGFTFTPNEESVRLGLDPEGKVRVGVSAQEVEAVLPEAVTDAPVENDQGYKTVQYEKMVPLLIEAIKELTEQNKELKSEVEILKSINSR